MRLPMAAKVPLELLSKLPVREAMAAVLFAAKGRPGNFGRIVAFKKPGNPDGLPGFLNALGVKIVSPKPMFSYVNTPFLPTFVLIQKRVRCRGQESGKRVTPFNAKEAGAVWLAPAIWHKKAGPEVSAGALPSAGCAGHTGANFILF